MTLDITRAGKSAFPCVFIIHQQRNPAYSSFPFYPWPFFLNPPLKKIILCAIPKKIDPLIPALNKGKSMIWHRTWWTFFPLFLIHEFSYIPKMEISPRHEIDYRTLGISSQVLFFCSFLYAPLLSPWGALENTKCVHTRTIHIAGYQGCTKLTIPFFSPFFIFLCGGNSSDDDQIMDLSTTNKKLEWYTGYIM